MSTSESRSAEQKKHVDALVRYLYHDELRSFEETYLDEEFNEDTHIFTDDQKDSIFYHLHMLASGHHDKR